MVKNYSFICLLTYLRLSIDSHSTGNSIDIQLNLNLTSQNI